jgi:hypothetical protein
MRKIDGLRIARIRLAGDPVPTHLMLRFSEFEDELIRLAANRRIFHVDGSRIAGIAKQATLARSELATAGSYPAF